MSILQSVDMSQVVRPLVGVNKVHLEAQKLWQFVTICDLIGSQWELRIQWAHENWSDAIFQLGKDGVYTAAVV